jgi:DnaJ-class molecular chaperone
MENKVHILLPCRACGGQAYVPTNEVMTAPDGHRYIRHRPCTTCQGSGMEERWVSFQEFAKMLAQVTVDQDA